MLEFEKTGSINFKQFIQLQRTIEKYFLAEWI